MDLQCIVSCFKHCFETNTTSQDVEESRQELIEQFIQDVREHQLLYSKIGIENLLNPAEEDDVLESITTESHVEFIVGNDDSTEMDTGDYEDDEVYSTAEELKALAMATAVMERKGRRT